MRGGTSRPLFFRRRDLPEGIPGRDTAEWDRIFCAALGTPDPNGRQLDGMGGGISSLSKVVVIGPPSRVDADVDYTFAQVAVGERVVGYRGNRGNISSAVGPFAVQEGHVPALADGEAVVRIHNTSTGKIIESRFAMQDGLPAEAGTMELQGVGMGAPILLAFRDPGGAATGKLLPTGHVADKLVIERLGEVDVSLVDGANSVVFVPAASVGLREDETPGELEAWSGRALFEAIRVKAAVAMGLVTEGEVRRSLKNLPLVSFLAAPARRGHRHAHDLRRPAAQGHAPDRRHVPGHRRAPARQRGAAGAAPGCCAGGGLRHRACLRNPLRRRGGGAGRGRTSRAGGRGLPHGAAADAGAGLPAPLRRDPGRAGRTTPRGGAWRICPMLNERSRTLAPAAPPAPDRLAAAASLPELYALLEPLSVGPGWAKPTPSLWPSPQQTFRPAHWDYARAKAALDAAGHLVDTKLAERRNLILANPVEGNTYATARTLVAAYQMILPGEQARSHRHTPNALRLIVDAEPGTYTVVDGERLPMLPGDVLLTPNWRWHGHGNDGSAPAYWIDVLDAPLVQLLEPMFLEHHPEVYEPVRATAEASPMWFPWAETQRRLEAAAPTPAGPWGTAVALGDPAMETVGLAMMRLSPGIATAAHRTTANNIFAVVQGEGESNVDGERIDWRRGDVFVVPAWRPQSHAARDGAVLLRITDEPAMAKLGFLREAAASGEHR
jgi:gentisate 1,2-dioxygenase